MFMVKIVVHFNCVYTSYILFMCENFNPFERFSELLKTHINKKKNESQCRNIYKLKF